jgi:hypothetical protein
MCSLGQKQWKTKEIMRTPITILQIYIFNKCFIISSCFLDQHIQFASIENSHLIRKVKLKLLIKTLQSCELSCRSSEVYNLMQCNLYLKIVSIIKPCDTLNIHFNI